MYVVKRDGHKEPVMFDKITDRIKKLCYGLNDLVDAVKVAMRVIEGLYDGVTTSELDNLAAETAASMTIAHPDYAQLAARIAISNLHKNTNKSFSETMNEMYHYVNPRTNQESPLLSEEVHKVIQENAEFLNSLQNEFGSRIGRFLKIQDRRLFELGLNYRKEITKDNEVWIGNAAQTLHPVAGQGLNLGLRDAFLLAEKLVGAFSGAVENQTPANIQSALESYAQSRKVDRTTTIGLTDFMARVFTSNLAPIVMARGLALSALQWLPPVKTALARQMMFGRR